MWNFVIKDFYNIIRDYGILGVCAGLLAVFCYAIYRYFRSKTYHRPFRFHADKAILAFIAALYCVLVLKITFFSREPGTRTATDLIPFSTFHNNPRSIAYIVENVLMTIPFGILVPMIWKNLQKLWLCLIAGFTCSLLIETFQFVSERGFFQTDDILTNVIGTMIGYGIYTLIRAGRKSGRG